MIEKRLIKIKTLADEKINDVKLQTRLCIFKNRMFFFFQIISHLTFKHFIILDIKNII